MATAMRRFGKRAVARTATIGSPTGGWNARDALSNMEATDAVQMVNWYPGTSDCILRRGATPASWGMDDTVETLMEYASPTAGSSKFFAITANGTIYDVSTGCNNAISVPGTGAVAAATTESGLSDGRWQYVNMQTAASTAYLLAVNGTDKLQGFDGSNWYTDGDGAHNITGVDTATCIHINVHKFRVWMIKKNTLSAYYLGTSAIQGVATEFTLAGTARRGGYLMAMGTWTLDAGYGVDDYAVFLTSEGEAIVYAGTNPAVAANWQLVGVWQIGPPIGRRCFVKYQGDLLVITEDGLVPLSAALQSSRLNPRVTLTDKIQSAVSEAVAAHGSNFGWQALPYPKGYQLYLNVPVTSNTQVEQYVMNTITKQWCKFQGWNANVWETFNHTLFFGGESTGVAPYTDTAGVVWLAWTEYTDYVVDNPSGVTTTTAATTDGTTVTITAVNRYSVGDSVVIAGLSAPWNGTFTVTGLIGPEGNSTGFTYSLVAAGPIADQIGTVTATPNWVAIDIEGNLQQAFSYYKGPTQLKRFTMMRPLWSSSSNPVPIYGGLNVDFSTSDPTAIVTGPVSGGGATWDVSSWDTTPWAGGLTIIRDWQSASGLGYCASPHYVVSTQGVELHLMATDIVYEIGGTV